MRRLASLLALTVCGGCAADHTLCLTSRTGSPCGAAAVIACPQAQAQAPIPATPLITPDSGPVLAPNGITPQSPDRAPEVTPEGPSRPEATPGTESPPRPQAGRWRPAGGTRVAKAE